MDFIRYFRVSAMTRTALLLQSGRIYIYNVSSFIRGLYGQFLPQDIPPNPKNKNIFNVLLVLRLALIQCLYNLDPFNNMSTIPYDIVRRRTRTPAL